MVRKLIDVDHMSIKEKIQAMEELWSSMDSNVLESPQWHSDVLDERHTKVEEGKASYVSLEEMKRKFK